MRLTVVGCSGSFPGPDSAASCYLVEAPHDGGTFRLVLDLGSGALGVLQRYTDLFAVDAVLLSHLHADHCLDLCPYYVVRKYFPDGQQHPPLPVYGPVGTAERVARAYTLAGAPGMRGEFHFRELAGERPLQLGPFAVTVAQVRHPVTTYAIRLDCGGSRLVYSGDTGPCQALVELASSADLLLCEASFLENGENPPDLHMTGREAAEHATRAGAGRLVLTHIPPWNDPQRVRAEAAQAYDGPLELAAPGATYEI